ncbi:hypothetical protein [Parasulfitobacter algicola]|uniref:Uncharacterized protein n=1 Tax=Parasulfitobacter algicola TaxID=2614809 RepID=A0ABX2IVJ0_9RHOB|nr:hypothetical protein [Sulfitobacter algicola]NSX56315.1 hypothetical protein [Sulfitobacter algicola]
MTAASTTDPRPIDTTDPSHPWEMDFTEAKQMMTIILRDNVDTSEEVELYAQMGAFLQSPLFDQLIECQRLAFCCRQQGQEVSTNDKGN